MANGRKDQQLDFIDQLDDLDGTQYEGGTDEDVVVEETDVDPDVDESASGPDDTAEHDVNQQYQTQPQEKPDQQKTQEEKNKEQEDPDKQYYQHPAGHAIDNKGNIVDPKTGTIIAKAGSERRLFEKSNRLNTRLETTERELNEYKKFVDQGRNLANEIKKHNFTPQELQEYMDTVVLYKTNPLEAAKRIVANVASMGYNVSEIVGNGVGDAVDMKAIQRMIDEKLSPITSYQQQERQTQATQQELQGKLQQFFDQHEYADIQAPVIDKLIGQRPDLTPSQAYYEVKTFCAKHGLDMSRPLEPQIRERQSSAQNTDNRQEQPRAQQGRKSIPARSSSPVQSISREVNQGDYAPANASWDDIIRQTLR